VRAIVQRVRDASVEVDGRVVGAIGHGLLVLAGVAADDTDDDRDWLARKIVAMRVFDDDAGVMNRSLRDVDGELLAVSQFTLFASTRKGNRPSWSGAAPPEIAKPKFDAFLAALALELGKPVATGVFGAMMRVALVNDGPVTIGLDSRARE
jgi:D-tyrosyl-tRNA(Tyr) deacylase